ncbi:MAG: 50S ribosomal protein L1 [Verrucomicrobia bacterium GWC2_42_7]|nr:MAG: 50S ribosomal protein L1 [Verrucomicrobia bacterium GWC2_42_7]
MQSKRYRECAKVADLTKSYSLKEAVDHLAKMPAVKFNETVELSVHLGVDPKQSDQMVRGTVNLPHGSGKKVRVLVFTEDPQVALDAGADYAGLGDLIKKIQDGWMDFDIALSTTAAMKEVRSIARVLGPRGLMPTPKAGTVVDNVAAGINEVKAGRVEFKMDKTANLAVIVGKKSFTLEQIFENAQKALDAVVKAKPESLKGMTFIESVTLSSTMSPGIMIDSKEYSNA